MEEETKNWIIERSLELLLYLWETETPVCNNQDVNEFLFLTGMIDLEDYKRYKK